MEQKGREVGKINRLSLFRGYSSEHLRKRMELGPEALLNQAPPGYKSLVAEWEQAARVMNKNQIYCFRW